MKPSPTHIKRILRYDPRTGLFWWRERASGRQMNRPAGSKDAHGYIGIGHAGKVYKAHILAWVITKGRWPTKGMDHKNRNKADNRWCNLRLATRSQNRFNMLKYRNNTSGYKGVSFHKGTKRWNCMIQKNKKYFHLGLFDDPKTAHAAYVSAAKRLHGEFSPN